MQDIEQTLLSFVAQTMLEGDYRDLSVDTNLIDSRTIDSFSTLQLVNFIATTFGVRIPLEEVNAQNLQTVSSIAALVRHQLHRSEAPR
jgi:acyl carrier protein